MRNLLDKYGYGDRHKILNQMNSLAQNSRKISLSWSPDVDDAQDEVHEEKTVPAIQELIEMHIIKQKMSTQLGFVLPLPVVTL